MSDQLRGMLRSAVARVRWIMTESSARTVTLTPWRSELPSNLLEVDGIRAARRHFVWRRLARWRPHRSLVGQLLGQTPREAPTHECYDAIDASARLIHCTG
jgi:hypothetical protein